MNLQLGQNKCLCATSTQSTGRGGVCAYEDSLTSTGITQTVYMGGLTAANHSCRRLSPVASMAACCASPGSGGTSTPSPPGGPPSPAAAAHRCRRKRCACLACGVAAGALWCCCWCPAIRGARADALWLMWKVCASQLWCALSVLALIALLHLMRTGVHGRCCILGGKPRMRCIRRAHYTGCPANTRGRRRMSCHIGCFRLQTMICMQVCHRILQRLCELAASLQTYQGGRACRSSRAYMMWKCSLKLGTPDNAAQQMQSTLLSHAESGLLSEQPPRCRLPLAVYFYAYTAGALKQSGEVKQNLQGAESPSNTLAPSAQHSQGWHDNRCTMLSLDLQHQRRFHLYLYHMTHA